MLDGLGLTKKDSDGYRLRTDNGQRLVIQLLAVKAFLDWPKQCRNDRAALARHRHLRRRQGDPSAGSRSSACSPATSTFYVWTNGGTELLYLYATWALPVDVSNGVYGIEMRQVVRVERPAGREAERSRTW